MTIATEAAALVTFFFKNREIFFKKRNIYIFNQLQWKYEYQNILLASIYLLLDYVARKNSHFLTINSRTPRKHVLSMNSSRKSVKEGEIPCMRMGTINNFFFDSMNVSVESPHWGTFIRCFLNGHLTGRWIGRGEPLPRPHRSPDITLIALFSLGICKGFTKDH